MLGEQIEDRRRGGRQRAVVEGQGDGAGRIGDVPERGVRSGLPAREQGALQARVGAAAEEQDPEDERERTTPGPVPARNGQRIRDLPCPSQ